MANLKSVFPPAYLKGEHLDGPVTLTIASADIDKGGKFGAQVVLTFVEPGYGKLYLNTSNRKACEKAFGFESDEWVGKQVKLAPAQVFSKTANTFVPGIVVIAA